MEESIGDTWSLQEIWNTKLNVFKSETKPRPYISASDVGKPFLDRYWKMKGIEVSNPYDERTLRVFDAGNIYEWLVTRVFKLAGILQASQVQVKIPATPSTMPLYGYLDLILGGNPNWQESRDKILQDNLPKWLEEKSLRLIDELEKRHPNGLEPIVAEVKSINSRAFWGQRNRDKNGNFIGHRHYRLQLYTYLLGQSIKKGRLFYISRDDLTLEEAGVLINDEMTAAWQKDVETMTHYYKNNIEPPQEPDLVMEKGKWYPNWRKAYSSYLTKMTGLEKDKWNNKWKYQADKLNKELIKQKTEEKKGGEPNNA